MGIYTVKSKHCSCLYEYITLTVEPTYTLIKPCFRHELQLRLFSIFKVLQYRMTHVFSSLLHFFQHWHILVFLRKERVT